MSFRPQSRLILLAGIERLADYQDIAYATEYLERLKPIRDVDSKYGRRRLFTAQRNGALLGSLDVV